MADPRVAEVVVVGLPHDIWIEAVIAFIVARENIALSEEDVIALCKKDLGRFEVPKRVVIVEQLPKIATGKLQKNLVKQQYLNLYQSLAQ